MALVITDKTKKALKCCQLLVNFSPVVSSSSNQPCTIYVRGDSAASQHYWREEVINCLKNIIIKSGPSVLLPNAEAISSTSQGQLSLSIKLSHSAKTAMILPQLKSALLISISQLCDNNCDVFLNKEKI